MKTDNGVHVRAPPARLSAGPTLARTLTVAHGHLVKQLRGQALLDFEVRRCLGPVSKRTITKTLFISYGIIGDVSSLDWHGMCACEALQMIPTDIIPHQHKRNATPHETALGSTRDTHQWPGQWEARHGRKCSAIDKPTKTKQLPYKDLPLKTRFLTTHMKNLVTDFVLSAMLSDGVDPELRWDPISKTIGCASGHQARASKSTLTVLAACGWLAARLGAPQQVVGSRAPVHGPPSVSGTPSTHHLL